MTTSTSNAEIVALMQTIADEADKIAQMQSDLNEKKRELEKNVRELGSDSPFYAMLVHSQNGAESPKKVNGEKSRTRMTDSQKEELMNACVDAIKASKGKGVSTSGLKDIAVKMGMAETAINTITKDSQFVGADDQKHSGRGKPAKIWKLSK